MRHHAQRRAEFVGKIAFPAFTRRRRGTRLALSYLRRVLHEAAGRGRVRHVPAKIDLDLDNLPISNDQHLRVAEGSSGVAMADSRHINPIVAGDDGDEVEARDPSAVRPAALEIGLSIE